ncbi:MAG TPA: carboxypeptidase-like regulatory domain-containing protein [Bacteroidia bacterium]|jgi:hypothetical protein|nr:carboxypeptidase-like regulatory domain-containing protein [Bacteroidia bacterium]
MKNKKDLKLSIPKPCSQDWDGMTKNNTGRHCHSCKKTVVDFSNFTDKELMEFFKKATGKICGRLNPYQIDRPMPMIEQSRHSVLYKTLLGTAVVAGISTSAFGQTTTSKNIPTVQTPPDSHVTMGEVSMVRYKVNHTISGRVKDATTKKPLLNAEVILEKANYIVYTDSTGVFTLNIPDSLVGQKLKLLFNTPGHAYLEKEITANKFPQQLNIALKPKRTEPFMGDISY